jgi:outer membrane receptor protein involved in Fe transport
MIHSMKSITTRCARLFALTPLAICGMLIGTPADAQEDAVFEEIVVLATRRAENILDVPVAVSTLSGTQIEQAGIKDVWDLQQNVPGLIVGRSQTSTTSNFSIRSIGSTSNNFGVESSVGLYVDGVYRSRQSSMINDLIDVEAVEVLRGPQGTLFGKNTAAGAISVRTVRPSQDRDAFIDLTYGDFGLVKASAAANIPINDNVAFRGTVFTSQRDGIVDDVNLGDDLYNDRDRMGARLQLAVNEPGDDFNMRIIADYAEIDETCCVAMARIDSLFLKGALPLVLSGQIDPFDGVGSDAGNALLGGTVFATYNYPQPLIEAFNEAPGTVIAGASWEDYVTAYNKPPISQNEDTGISLEVNKTLTDSVTLKSITAVRAFETFDDADVDFSDVDLIGRTNTAEQSSLSQEFQFTGEFGEGSSWVAGAYYFSQDLDSTTRTTAESLLNTFAILGRPSLAELITNINALDDGLEQLSAATGDPTFAALLTPTDPFPAGANAFDVVKQEHDGYAIFGQVDWAISDKFTLSLGARFTDETKKINATYQQTANGPLPDDSDCTFDPANPFVPLGDYTGGDICATLTEASIFLTPVVPDGMGGFIDNPCYLGGDPDVLGPAQVFCADLENLAAGGLSAVSAPSLAWGFWEFAPFAPRSNVIDELKDDQTTGTVKLTFFPAESTMLYLSYSTGFKAGGTNADRVLESDPQLFDAETSKSLEAGLKGQYGPVQVVATVYQTDFEDFQANSFAGGGFILRNAGDLSIEGVELELLWRPTDTTEISAWYAHNEGTYDSFEEGVAWDAWVLQYGLWQTPPQGDPGCPGPVDPSNLPETCSRTGDKLPYNPEDRLFVSFTQEFGLGANTSGYVRLEYSRNSSQWTDGDNDPLQFQDGYDIVNARLGFNFDNINSSLTFWGRNITDERYYHGGFDIPFSYDKVMSYPSEPATWGVTFRKNFD